MALVVPPPNDKKRVKVYELRNNDWFDRGTGFCTGRVVSDESKVYVESEDQPERMLLETKISKDDGYQKQQDTLIVWTESNGTDMALSFQEAEGCAAIWDFVSQVQQHLLALGGPDDALSDDAMDSFANPLVLPQPELGNLEEIVHMMRAVQSTPQGRDSLCKFIITEDYIRKIIPLVNMAEDLESLDDLHHLCNIMKMLILLNDTQIIEHVVSDGVVLGVVGALEYDPDFPGCKTNHRRYLRDHSRYKEVVPITDLTIKKKIHATWRLQYLKDVVLARILDDPTFSVLNSLIFFNQVDILTHLQVNTAFLEELFGIVNSAGVDLGRRKDAVFFIQTCCATGKNLQAPARQTLYTNFIQNGLLRVISFALSNQDASIRVAGTDILVAMIDHDPAMVRAYIFKAIGENKTSLTDTLIDLLLVEVDLGVKAQAADALKVLLETQGPFPTPEATGRVNGEYAMSKFRGTVTANAQSEAFVNDFYDGSANKLFQPLRSLEHRASLHDLSYQEVSLLHYLIEILMFLTRSQTNRSKRFIFDEGIASRIAQLISCPQKHLKLTALKYFRTCITFKDNDYYVRQMAQTHLLEPILNIVCETMPRDNLLNSVGLEFFEFVKRDNLKPIILHVVETFRERLQEITYVDTFQNLILRYDQMQAFQPDVDATLFGQESDNTPDATKTNGNQRWQGVRDLDAVEEAYFNTSDDEDETPTKKKMKSVNNGVSQLQRCLVDYPDDDDDVMDMCTPTSETNASDVDHDGTAKELTESTSSEHLSSIPPTPPPEKLSEKRRREEDDEEDELVKLSHSKRRSSSASSTNNTTGNSGTNNVLRRKKGFTANSKGSPTGSKKIEISLAIQSSGNTNHKRDDGA